MDQDQIQGRNSFCKIRLCRVEAKQRAGVCLKNTILELWVQATLQA